MTDYHFRYLRDQLPKGPFTRAKVGRFTSLSDDVLAHWTKEGLLLPVNESSGPGNPKEFDLLEVNKAAVLAHMRNFGCGVDTLKYFASLVDRGRRLATLSPYFPLGRLWYLASMYADYQSVLNGGRIDIYEEIEGSWVAAPARTLEDVVRKMLDEGAGKKHNEEEVAQAVAAVQQMDGEEDRKAASICDFFSIDSYLDRRVDAIVFAWPTPGGWKFYQDSDANMSGLQSQAGLAPPAGILLYVSKILRRLWSINEQGL